MEPDRRISNGSVTTIQVNQLLKQFEEMRKMMKLMTSGGPKAAMRMMKNRVNPR